MPQETPAHPVSPAPHRLKVAIVGGGMFFDEVIGHSFKDFMRGGIAPGLNAIGMSHMAPAVGSVEIDVVAVGTSNPAAGTAEKIVKWFSTDLPSVRMTPHYGPEVWNEMIARHKPDVLFVATPDDLHARPIVDALEAGVDVITEKPLCLTTAEADKIIHLARKEGLIVAVDLHKRYDPFVREMMSKAPTTYGSINRVRAVLEEPLSVSTEVFKWASRSNPFAYVGCHWLDVVHHYLSVRPVSVFATGQKNLLVDWDKHVVEIARRQRRTVESFKSHGKIHTWDSLDVNVTYDTGMRGDYCNNWINPPEFEGAVNQEIEVVGIYGRGFVDQQDRGYRETIIGDGTRTRNPTFNAKIHHAGGYQELFGYGKASIVAGLLAIIRRRFFHENPHALVSTYPSAASQRDVVRVIEAAGIVAERNYQHFIHDRGTPVTAMLDGEGIVVVDPYSV